VHCLIYYTVIHRLMIHPNVITVLTTFLQLLNFLKIMTICLKLTRTDFQNMKFIEWFLSEIQVKHWCIIQWEYITAKYDLAVVHPKVICFAWNFVRRIIQYITMHLSIYFFKKDAHVSSYKSVSLGGGVSLAGGWLYVFQFHDNLNSLVKSFPSKLSKYIP